MPNENSIDRQGLVVLSTDECWELVANTPVGRVAFVADGQPTLLPVNHRLVGHNVVFLTTRGTKLGAAARARPVAFEVDEWDKHDRSGWSVVIQGTSDVVLEAEEIAELESLDLHPWATGTERTDWVRILAYEISGRRIPMT